MKQKIHKALSIIIVGVPLFILFLLWLTNLIFGFGYILADWCLRKLTLKLGRLFHEINTKTNL